MRLLWAILVLLLLSNSANGQPPPEAEPTVEELLIRANSKKALAVREIAQLPNRVEGEVNRIMTKLDNLFQGQIQESFNKHYEKVEQSLKTVSLPEDVSSLEVARKQYEALANSSALEALVEDFIRRAESKLEPLREELVKDIDTQLDETLTAELKKAQDTIREPFQDIVARYFPVWDVSNLHAPPLPAPPELQKEDRSNVPPVEAIIGLLLVILRRRIVNMVTRKMAGKTLGKLIPFAGFALLSIEVWDAIQAKADLEHELRTQFPSTYQEEFSPNTIWDEPVEEGEPSTRQQLEQQVSTSLQAWSEHCRKEVERMLHATRVFALSPNVKNYITEQTEKGRDTQEIIEDMHLVGEMFGQGIINQAPLGDLLLMIVHAPDRRELARLAHELDTWLLEEYAQHGREVLIAANRLGVPTFLKVVRVGEKLDWYDVHTVFEQYPRDLSEPTRQGLVLALSEQVATSGVAPTTLENIARHEKLFQSVAPLVRPDTKKLFRLFGSPSVVDIVDRTYQKNPEVAQALLHQWPVRTWERYRDQDRFNALLDVAAYRLTERRQTAHDFAREFGERDELTYIFVDVGLCGVQLWDTYVGPAAGQHQHKTAENAISLYKKGYPCEALQTQEGLNEVQLYEFLPFGIGLQVFHKVRPLGIIAYWSGIFLILLLVAVPATRLLRKLGKRDAVRQQKAKDDGTGEAVKSPPRKPEPQ